MDLYIDKENLESLISNRKNERYNDCFRVIQKQLNLYFNFEKNEILKNDLLKTWFSMLTQGVGKHVKHEFLSEKFPTRPLKHCFHKNLNSNQLSSIFLLNENLIADIKNSGVLLIGEKGDEISTLSKLFLLQEDYDFDKKLKIGGEELNQWSDLTKFSFPITDIIIIDSFIASDISLIDTNLIQLIKTLSILSRVKMNILIYTNHDKIALQFNELSSKVKEALKSVTGEMPYFTLVKYRDQRNIESFAEHDRTIFTNYNRYYSGDTYNYFKSDGTKITKGRELLISNYGKSENHNLAKELIQDIQENIKKIPANSIEGDKKSNFITFI